MRIYKDKRGITLIALVVTIIVLLILAGVRAWKPRYVYSRGYGCKCR